ncbi:pantothenate kinase type III [Pseudomonas frederiksbergensis]
MILELDCGNSFIKWRVLGEDVRRVIGEGVVDTDLALLESLRGLKGLALMHCRLVSVRTAEETSALISLLTERFWRFRRVRGTGSGDVRGSKWL